MVLEIHMKMCKTEPDLPKSPFGKNNQKWSKIPPK